MALHGGVTSFCPSCVTNLYGNHVELYKLADGWQLSEMYSNQLNTDGIMTPTHTMNSLLISL